MTDHINKDEIRGFAIGAYTVLGKITPKLEKITSDIFLKRDRCAANHLRNLILKMRKEFERHHKTIRDDFLEKQRKKNEGKNYDLPQ